MIPTPTDEIRAARRELAARLGNDIHRIAEETRRCQRESGRAYVSLPVRPPQHGATPDQTPPTGSTGTLSEAHALERMPCPPA